MQPVTGVPFYFDWTFWTVIIAVLALVLSQLPPVYTILGRAKLDIELFSWIHLSHKVGNPNVQLHFILTNVGGRSVRVKGATIVFKRDGKLVATLPARNYLQNPNDKSGVLFTPFFLKSKEEWAHIVNFLEFFSREKNKEYRNAESNIKVDIVTKRKLPENKDILVEADNKNVLPFMAMFKENFVWLPGEYEVNVSIHAAPERVGVKKDYRFTLFESDSEELSRSKDDYKFGDGIYWDSDKHAGVVVQISEAKT